MAKTSGIASKLVNSFGSQNTSSFGNMSVPVEELLGLAKTFFGQPSRGEMAASNEYAEQAGFATLSQAKNASQHSASLARQGYQDKLDSDYNQALRMQNLAGGRGTGGGLDSWDDGIYKYIGQVTGPPTMPRVEFRKTVDPEYAKQQKLNQQSGEYELKKIREQGESTRRLSAQEAQQNYLLTDKQLFSQASLARLQSDTQKDVIGMQTAAQVAASKFGAMGNVLGSLFGSVNSGSPNYRYWS